jgi:L,D-transpeptidase catalytic domain
MKKKLKSLCLVIVYLFFYLLQLPFAFARSATGNKLVFHPGHPLKKITTDPLLYFPEVRSVYDSLQLGISGLSRQAFDYAQKGLHKLVEQGRLINDSIISIIDFTQPSSKKRLYILDVKNYKVLFNTLVAHGKNSGREWASSFSNRPYSFKSSPGFYITGETYNGNNGYSLKLEGVEKGINDNAYNRAIVIHGAGYVSQSFVNTQGYIGRSEGCPAVPVQDNSEVIQLIQGGTCLFIYSTGQEYLEHSTVLN